MLSTKQTFCRLYQFTYPLSQSQMAVLLMQEQWLARWYADSYNAHNIQSSIHALHISEGIPSSFGPLAQALHEVGIELCGDVPCLRAKEYHNGGLSQSDPAEYAAREDSEISGQRPCLFRVYLHSCNLYSHKWHFRFQSFWFWNCWWQHDMHIVRCIREPDQPLSLAVVNRPPIFSSCIRFWPSEVWWYYFLSTCL